MAKVRLIHWNAEEAAERADWLRAGGYEVACEQFDRAILRAIADDLPDAVVIDLGRLPSQGRDVGMTLRKQKATRNVPLVFVDGEPGKVARVRELLPDATYTTWPDITRAVAHTIANPPEDPVTPRSVMDSYAGTPLVKKLGIRDNYDVVLVGAPGGIEATLGELPKGARLCRDVAAQRDLTLWFVRSRRGLEAGVAKEGARAGRGGLWVIWPKKTSGVASDLSQTVVREVGLAAGLVDYKICSVDATWSGLRFTRRKSP